MRASLSALTALLLASGISVHAADQIPKLEIDSRAWQNDDWAPGEVDSWSSDSASEPGECSWVGEAFESDCTVTPNTPENPPAVAPDNCLWYDRTYDADIYMLWGCG